MEYSEWYEQSKRRAAEKWAARRAAEAAAMAGKDAPAPDNERTNQPDNQPTKGTQAMNEQEATNAHEPAAPAPDAAPAPAKGETPAPAAKRAPAKGKPAPARLIVSLTEAAAMLGQSPTEVRRWERMGAMPPLVKLPTRGTGKARRLYFRAADIVAMVDGLTASAGGR